MEPAFPNGRGTGEDMRLIAGIGLSEVRVYQTPSVDGHCGGSPHLHLVCGEMYFPLRGTGAAEFLTELGPQRLPLVPGQPVQFTPGTLHRLVNTSGLEVLVIMENGRVNEEGDAVFTFPEQDLTDPATYHALADVGPSHAPDPAAVQRRRDRATTGFLQLIDCWNHDPEQGLRRLHTLYERAAHLIAPRAAQWPHTIRTGPAQAVDNLLSRAQAIAATDTTHLSQGRVIQLTHLDDNERLPRMCGMLWPYTVQA